MSIPQQQPLDLKKHWHAVAEFIWNMLNKYKEKLAMAKHLSKDFSWERDNNPMPHTTPEFYKDLIAKQEQLVAKFTSLVEQLSSVFISIVALKPT